MIVMDMLGVDKLASSLAVTMTVQGLAVFIGPTIAGTLHLIHISCTLLKNQLQETKATLE